MNTSERTEIMGIVESARQATDAIFYREIKHLTPVDAKLSSHALSVIERLCESLTLIISQNQDKAA